MDGAWEKTLCSPAGADVPLLSVSPLLYPLMRKTESVGIETDRFLSYVIPTTYPFPRKSTGDHALSARSEGRLEGDSQKSFPDQKDPGVL